MSEEEEQSEMFTFGLVNGPSAGRGGYGGKGGKGGRGGGRGGLGEGGCGGGDQYMLHVVAFHICPLVYVFSPMSVMWELLVVGVKMQLDTFTKLLTLK
jgi:hypothetical protein